MRPQGGGDAGSSGVGFRRHLVEAPGTVKKRPRPEFEREQRVEPETVVGGTGSILAAQACHYLGIHEVAIPQRPLRKEILDGPSSPCVALSAVTVTLIDHA